MNPYKQGAKAYKQGIPKEDNPHHYRPSFNDWLKGWEAARHIDKLREQLDEASARDNRLHS